ncbi:hypothetical protein AVEN_139644-1 [Araneus ventricosus]|uniref:Uncharacterized protein n=1 Tax=Araneus ventricosus TaxID=182803 RepID=A0A4Y2FYR0_ARAVE|nr:hypothetical protein AVEN_139644-1 [Araneus ventricosus]
MANELLDALGLAAGEFPSSQTHNVCKFPSSQTHNVCKFPLKAIKEGKSFPFSGVKSEFYLRCSARLLRPTEDVTWPFCNEPLIHGPGLIS